MQGGGLHGLMQSGPSMGMPQMGMPGMDPVYTPSRTLPQPFPYPSPTLPVPILNPSPVLLFIYPSPILLCRIPTTTRIRERKSEREIETDFGCIDILNGVCVCVCVRACVCVHGTCQPLFSLSRLPYTGIHGFRMCPPLFASADKVKHVASLTAASLTVASLTASLPHR
jgi:hypothetical protein